MAMRSLDFVAYAEQIASSERACEARLLRLETKASSLESEISSLESEIRYLDSEIASAYYIDEEGNYRTDTALVSAIRSQQASLRAQISMKEGELRQTRSAIAATETELARIRSEKSDAIFEIQSRAATTSQNISKAGMMIGDYSGAGAHLQSSFQTSLNALSRAASILGSHIASGGGGGGARSRGMYPSGSRSGSAQRDIRPHFSGALHALSGSGTGAGHSAARFQSSRSGARSAVRSMRNAGSSSQRPKRQRAEFRSAKASAAVGSAVFTAGGSTAPAFRSGSAYTSSRSTSGIGRKLHAVPKRRGEGEPIDLNLRYASNSRFTQNGVRCYTDDNGQIYRMNNKLLCDRSYTLNGYNYRTDSIGRIVFAEGMLQKKDHDGRGSMTADMRDIGKTHSSSNDERGHLFGDQFNGAGSIGNTVPMNEQLNGVRYRALEQKLAVMVRDNHQVHYAIRPVYHGNSFRPVGFAVDYTVDGEPFSERFYNEKLG